MGKMEKEAVVCVKGQLTPCPGIFQFLDGAWHSTKAQKQSSLRQRL